MDSSRKPSLMTFLAGSLLAGLVVFFSFATAPMSVGCTTAETSPAPDAAPPPCQRGPFLFCTEVGPDQQGCNAADGTSPMLSVLPRLRYAVGCTVNFVGERDPLGGDCRLEAVCKCVMGQPVATVADGGGGTSATDAGADAEAGAPLPVPIQPVPDVPVWQCYP